MNNHIKLVVLGAIIAGVLGYFFTMIGQDANFPSLWIGAGNAVLVLITIIIVNLINKK